MPVETKTKPDTKVYELKNLKLDTAGEGTFEAAFANLNAIDHDGDTYDPGAIGEQAVMISQWNHGSWDGGVKALPLGVGKTFERDGWGMVAGEFDMDDPDAVKTHRKLKYLKEKGFPVEFSFALPSSDWRMEEINDQMIRVFTRISIPEVSPVLLGAGVDTHLTSIKGREGDSVANLAEMIKKEIEKTGDVGELFATQSRSTQFVTQVDEAVIAVESVIGRAKEIRNLREEKAKDDPMSKRNTRRLRDLKAAMADAILEIDDLLADPDDELNELAKSIMEGNDA